MKNLFQYIVCIFLFSVVIFTSCVKQDFKNPELVTPDFKDSANITIANLVALHVVSGQLDSIKGDTIITGVVTGNDETGNIYKYMVIQDHTAGIVINIDIADYNNEYKIGQRVYVKCKGLVLGDYGGLPQLGMPYFDGGWKVGRIPAVYIKNHIFKDSLPGKDLTPKTVDCFNQLLAQDKNKLVTLTKVTFPDAGQTYAGKYETTDRYLIDSTGASIKVRTSNYADFAQDIMPSGIGTVTGVLGYYSSGAGFQVSNCQLIIRNISEVKDFVPTINFTENFTSSLGSFTQFSVTGAQKWEQSTLGGRSHAKMSGYVSPNYYANEDWLISKPMDFSLFTTKIFSFESAMRYGSTNDGTLKVFYSTDYSGAGNPNLANWTEVPGYQLSPALSSWGTWTLSGDVNLSSINASKIFIAFKYICSTSNVPTWEITNVKVRALN